MLSARPALWGSALEDSSRPSPAFVYTDGPTGEVVDLQFAALSLPESAEVIFDSQEHLPSIDEALFDFVEVPELEDVAAGNTNDDDCPLVSIGPLDDLLYEEIPALEDVLHDQDLVHQSKQWFTEAKSVASVPTIVIDAASPAALTVIESPPCASSPAGSFYVESCGSESPVSYYSGDDALLASSEKRRRVSQISNSSYCSSPADSLYSPSTSVASDSDFEVKRGASSRCSSVTGGAGGGRRSRFTPEDRKERKKAQNRTAAERYRQKRKLQEETIGEQEQALIDGNGELRIEVTKLQAEVSCLKRLLREMLQAKGVPLPSPQKKIKLAK